ncbi:MAG: PQQ-binding-like beta-propeller repeat protein [Planctomycetes bacterium]|nr:PQQ-binding-like beta-propeller repeat protein [Planctomycetota bacterium]
MTGYANFRLETFCIQRSTGEILWRKAAPANRIEKVHQVGSPASSTCCTDGERVYVYFGSYGLICYDFTGKQLWQRPMLMPENLYGSASSPILAGGKLIFLDDQELRSRLLALDPRTGQTIWERERMGFKANWSTPMYWNNDGVEELVVYGTQYVIGYDLNDGLERWTIPGMTHEPCITPVAGEGLVFISSYCMNRNTEILGPPKWADLVEKYDKDDDGELSYEEVPEKLSILSRYDDDGEGDHPLREQFNYLDANKDGKLSGREYNRWGVLMNTYWYENAIMGIRPGDVEEAKPAEIVWKQTEGVPEVPSPLYYKGRLYTVKNGGIVTCQVAATGERKYMESLGVGGPYYGSLVAGDGKIFAAATRGVVTVFEAGDEFKILAKNKIGERVMATPALVDGVVYVRTEKALWAFGEKY